jgi:hypothetical protein
MSETALAVAKDYPADKFNLLIPVRTMQELSPLHKVVINEVQISSDPRLKDTYPQSGGLALTKNGLMKLMAAANIQIIDSHPVPTQRCNKCIEIAQRTKQAPKCFECPYIDDIAHQVTIAVPEPSGTFRVVKATKELRMEDEKAKMKDAEFKQFVKFKTEHCESKALNRALREGLMVKPTYTAEELKKPFAVALVMPNMSDPDLKRAMVDRYANNAAALYGNVVPVSSQNALPSGDITVVDADDDQIIDVETGEIMDADPVDPEPPTEPEPVLCTLCGKILEPFTDRNKKDWSVQDTVDYSTERCGQVLCIGCAVKEIRKRQKAEKEGK